MPTYTYSCGWCNTKEKKLLPSLEKAKIERYCETCNQPMVRQVGAASSQVKEIVDNGIMAKKVELTKKE